MSAAVHDEPPEPPAEKTSPAPKILPERELMKLIFPEWDSESDPR